MDTDQTWSETDLAQLNDLKDRDCQLPNDAPRALLSVRLSVFNDDTTSPIRQELDLRRFALDHGYRVAGVASDLNVSATKVPPWKRKSLGDWLNNRVPEFDAIMFWKLDRFIRNLNDLNVMIRWAETYDKNLMSKNDPIDLSTTMGKIMVTFIGGVAEIESANTKARVESMWAYAKTQEEWIVGKPPYGYRAEVQADGKRRLVIVEEEAEALRYARDRVMAGASLNEAVRDLKEKGLMSSGLTSSTLKRRLCTPGLLGYRVEFVAEGSVARRTRLLYDSEGQPIRVAPAIFQQEEWDELQAALEKRMKRQPGRDPNGATMFLGVLKCADCGANMVVHKTTQKPNERNRLKEVKTYAYLRCYNCPNGGLGAPDPQSIYEGLVEKVLALLGDYPVQSREYARGEEARQKVADLQRRISYYMTGLEPGGRLTKTKFAEQQAEAALDAAIAELEAIDPETTEDRWILQGGGQTFRQHWQAGGMKQLAEDLKRAGVECSVARTRVPGQRAPDVELTLRVPIDVEDRLIQRADEFESPL